jgi:hypothetical protein
MSQKREARKARIIIDPTTGLPVMTVGGDIPSLTSCEVAKLLAEFP